MTVARFRSAGYALMIEDNPDQKIQSKQKTYAPVAFGSKIFSPAQLKMSIYSKKFLPIYMAFLEFAHILWEATRPTIVLTDNKSVTPFFQTNAIPPALWSACDYVLQINFKIAHIAGSVNTAADFLSRLELKVTEKIRLKIREDIHKTPNTSYSINGIKADARIGVEQDVDLMLKNKKLKILGQPYDEVLIMTDSRYKNYRANEDRIILKDGLPFRK